MEMTAKHALRGTMKALYELGISQNSEQKTVDDIAAELTNNLNQKTQQVISVDPTLITNWEFHDRPEEELGDIDALANELKNIGQQQPCIVRPISNNSNYKFEVIAGERRWRAALKAQINLNVIVRHLNDPEAAICQAGENSQRNDLSEFAKGMNYAKLIKENLLSRHDLQEKLNISKSSVRDLLSFERIKPEILDKIVSKINLAANLAYEITRLQEKGEQYINALISITPILSTQKIGVRRLHQLINKKHNETVVLKASTSKDVFIRDGIHAFSWKVDSNGSRTIVFPKANKSLIDFKDLEECIKLNLETQLVNKDKDVDTT